jgi:hypothetical protein
MKTLALISFLSITLMSCSQLSSTSREVASKDEAKDYVKSVTVILPQGSAATEFSELEQLGVERMAEKSALELCLESNTVCTIVSARILKCNSEVDHQYPIRCIGTATASGKK